MIATAVLTVQAMAHQAVALVALQDPTSTTAAPTPLKSLNLVSPVWGYVLMALLSGAIIGVSLLPSKRGHQD